MAGGRIRPDELPALLEVGLGEIHVGSAAFGEHPGITDARAVRSLIDGLRSAGNRAMTQGEAP